MLDSSDDEVENEKKGPASKEEPSQQEIDAFLGEDSDSESEVESSQEPAAKDSGPHNLSADDVMTALDQPTPEKPKPTSVPCRTSSPQPTSSDVDEVEDAANVSGEDFMEEYRKMEEMMAMMRAKKEELEKKGIVPSQKSPSPSQQSLKTSSNQTSSSQKSSSQVPKEVRSSAKPSAKTDHNLVSKSQVSSKSTPSKSSSSKQSSSSSSRVSSSTSQKSIQDCNLDLFSSQTVEDDKKPSPSITKPGRPRHRPGNVVNVNDIKPGTNFYKSKSAPSLADDDDSDWDGMDGERPDDLNPAGEEVKRIIKRADGSRVAHAPKNDAKPAAEQPQKAAPPKVSQLMKKVEEDIWKDSFSGMKISKPLISESMMESRMQNRKLVRMSRIGQHARKSLTDLDWVTIGCIVGKSDTRTSAKGSQYMIWTLSDLEECDNSVKLFLFGDSYKQLWKESVGTVLGILNPSFMANEDKNNSGVALTVDNWQKVMKLGTSRDYGVCKATTKSGKTCFNFINKSQGEYCTYHVQAAYRKACSKRSELQAGYSGPKPKSFMKKIFPSKNDTVYYGGQSFTMENNSGGKSVTASSIRSSASGTGGGKKNAFTLNNLQNKDDKLLAGLNSQGGLQDCLALPTRGSMNLLKHLSKEEKREKEKREGQKTVVVKPSDLIKQTQRDFLLQKQARSQKENVSNKNSKQKLDDAAPKLGGSGDSGPQLGRCFETAGPQLGRGFHPGMEISLDEPSKPFSPARKNTMSKAEAAAKLRVPLTKADPNATKKKASPEVQKRIKKRLAETMAPPGPEEKGAPEGPPAAKRPKILGGLDLQSPEVQKMLKAGSSHKGAVAEIEADREEKYFMGLEKRETMEQKMLSVTQIKVSVVTCKLCQYTIDGKPNDSCSREHRHALVHSKMHKKFFKCTSCGERATAFDKYPNHNCSKCGGGGFERCSMWKERKGPLLDSEKLLLRGEERKYVNT